MSASTAIRTAIAGVIASVEGAGVVHAFERYAEQGGKFRALYQAPESDRIRGWHIRRTGRQERRHSTLLNEVTTTWSIVGVASFLDAESSEIAVDELVDAIAAAFRADRFLGGLADTVTADAAGVQLRESGPVMFGKALCHRVELGLTTLHYEAPAEAIPDCDGETRLRLAWGLAGIPDNQAYEAEDDINLEGV